MRVLAKAYRGRPLDRITVADIDESHVAVATTDATDGQCVGFPVYSLFAYDPAIMRSLEAAWQASDSNALAVGWAKARPIRPEKVRAK